MREPVKWPVVVVELGADGGGRVSVAGEHTALPAGSVEQSMQTVVERAASLARHLGGPVRLRAIDPTGAWEHVVDGDGVVHTPPAQRKRAAKAPQVPASARLTRGPSIAVTVPNGEHDDPSAPVVQPPRAGHPRPASDDVVAVMEDERTVIVQAPPRAAALLTVVSTEQSVELQRAAVVVGRRPRHAVGAAPAGSIYLDDPTRQVSRRHVQLMVIDAELEVVDLGSSNGTWIIDAGGIEHALTESEPSAIVSLPAHLRLGDLEVSVDLPRD